MGKAVLTLAVLLVLLPIVQADIIENVSFSGDGITRTADNKTYILPNRELQAQMTFDMVAPYAQVIVDTSTLNTRPRSTAYASIDRCPNRRCTVPVVLNVSATGSQTYRDVPFTVFDVNGEEDEQRFRFSIDTGKPQFSSIGTESCSSPGRQCFLQTGANTVVARFTERESGIERASAFLLVDGASVPASSCDTATCTFAVTVPAGSSRVSLQLNPGTTDRAGNALQSAPGQVQFLIDDDEPRIISAAVVSGSNSGVPIVTGPFDLKVQVEDLSSVSLRVPVADIEAPTSTGLPAPDRTAVCSAEELCVVRISPLVGRNDTVPLRFEVIDAAGHAVEQTIDVQFAVTRSEQGDFWNVAPNVDSLSIDRGTAKLFTKQLYVPLSLRQRQGSPEVAYVSVSQCGIYNQQQLTSLNLDDPRVLRTTDENPILILSLPPSAGSVGALNDLPNQLELRCKVNTMSLENGYLYTRAEEDVITVPVRLLDNPLITTNIEKLREEAQADIDNMQTRIAGLQRLYSTGTIVCTTAQVLTATDGTLAGVQGALATATAGTASAPVRVGREGISRTATNLIESDFGHTLCAAISCQGTGVLSRETIAPVTLSLSENGALGGIGDGRVGRYFDTAATAAVGSPEALINPYKSEYVAYATACLPAVLYHWNTKQAINCEYQQCVTGQADAGMLVSACEAKQSFDVCRYNTGAVFYLTPLGSLQTIRDSFINIVANPYALLGYVSPLICEQVPSDIANAACVIPKALGQFRGISGLINNVQQYSSAFSSAASNNAGTCPRPQEPPNPYQNQFPTGVNCGVNHCEYNGYVRYGRDYYQIREVQTPAAAEPIPPNAYTPVVVNPPVGVPTSGSQGQPRAQDPQTSPVIVTPPYTGPPSPSTPTSTAPQSPDEIERAAAVARLRNGYELVRVDPPAAIKDVLGTELVDERVGFTTNSDVQLASLRQELDDLNKEYMDARDDRQSLRASSRRLESSAVRDYLSNNPCSGVDPEACAGHVREGLRERGVTDERVLDEMESSIRQNIESNVNPRLAEVPADELNTIAEAAVEQAQESAEAQDEELKEIEEEAKDDVDEAKSNVRTEETERYRDRLSGDTRYLLGEMANSAAAANQLASLMGLNTKEFFGTGYGVEWLDEQLAFSDLEKQAIEAVCSSKVRQERSVVGITDQGTVGMAVFGSRTAVAELPDDIEMEAGLPYQYLVGGQLVIARPIDATFSIYLDGRSGRSDEPIYSGDLAQQTSFSWHEGNLLKVESEEEYEKICVEFSRDVRDIFATTTYEGTDVCIRLGGVTE